MAIEVLLPADRDIIRAGMRRLIGTDPETAVVGEAACKLLRGSLKTSSLLTALAT